jgi:hypothetical protein
MDMMTLAMHVVAVLGAADVNDAHGYYHCSNKPNFARGYCGNHSCSYYACL